MSGEASDAFMVLVMNGLISVLTSAAPVRTLVDESPDWEVKEARLFFELYSLCSVVLKNG